MKEHAIRSSVRHSSSKCWRDLVGRGLSSLCSRSAGLHWAQRTVRVLLAHSDPGFRRVLKAGLTQLGFAVEEVVDGPALLDRLGDMLLDGEQGKRPDLVIADLGLRGCDRQYILGASRMFGVQTPWILTSQPGHYPADHEKMKKFEGAVLVELPMDWVDFLTVISVLLERSLRKQSVFPDRSTLAMSQLAASA